MAQISDPKKYQKQGIWKDGNAKNHMQESNGYELKINFETNGYDFLKGCLHMEVWGDKYRGAIIPKKITVKIVLSSIFVLSPANVQPQYAWTKPGLS